MASVHRVCHMLGWIIACTEHYTASAVLSGPPAQTGLRSCVILPTALMGGTQQVRIKSTGHMTTDMARGLQEITCIVSLSLSSLPPSASCEMMFLLCVPIEPHVPTEQCRLRGQAVDRLPDHCQPDSGRAQNPRNRAARTIDDVQTNAQCFCFDRNS